MSQRIGFGYDVHRLKKGRPLMLGGILVPHTKGLEGHSDADVLIHAICDALLGAAGLRDIGFQFPYTNPEFKNIDSKILLGQVFRMITKEGFRISNIDATVCAEVPKINPVIHLMIEVLSPILHISASQISIKATTNEKMGFIGRKKGISAYAVVLIEAIHN